MHSINIINVDDADAGTCLRFLTDLDRSEIESLDQQREATPEKRESQRRLAEALTRLVHGEEGLETAQRATAIFFGAEIEDLTDGQLGEIFADVSSKQLSHDQLSGEGLSLIDALYEAGLAKSKGDARRTIKQGGAYVNNRRISDINARLDVSHLASQTVMVLRSGKKRYALLRFDGV